jgi:hypothetical protein
MKSLPYLHGAEEVDEKITSSSISSRPIYGWRVKGLLEEYEDKVKRQTRLSSHRVTLRKALHLSVMIRIKDVVGRI